MNKLFNFNTSKKIIYWVLGIFMKIFKILEKTVTSF